MRLWLHVLGIVALIFGVPVRGAVGAITPNAALEPPEAATILELTRAAAPDRWAANVPAVRQAARTAYENERWVAARGWLHIAKWAELFARTEAQFTPTWIKAVESAQVAHPQMRTRYEMSDLPLGRSLSVELQTWLVNNEAFSAEFFAVLTPQDYVPEVFRILNALHQRDPITFARYASLALAIALVYDVPPPPHWPHGQVTSSALPRKWPAPSEAFNWWVREDLAGRTYHRLARLPADELKFVVDAVAPFEQLVWAQRTVNVPLAQLDQAYAMIRYRKDRIAKGQAIWPGPNYTLRTILRDGGICVDQAYFATEVGKALGVPTLLFYGAGKDGRHAWFGFLDGAQTWRLDAGRFEEQRLVSGLALDPQTWREISDHELKFLTERFRAQPLFRESELHAAFAADYLATGRAELAVKAARRAVAVERRNLAAWETLLAAEAANGGTARQLEGTLRAAVVAFQAYPDLEVLFSNRISASLRARGEGSAARMEERIIAEKNQAKRSDLSARQAREILARSIASDRPAAQILVFNSIMENYGRGAGIDFFDHVVVFFAQHLMRTGDKASAQAALARARQTLRVEPHSQLAGELTKLETLVRGN